jgi:transcriptional regulator with XRE-family HTH domain
MGFADRLRALMAERGLSGLAVTRKVHCDQAYISRLASGKRRPSRKIAILLDDALDAGGELAALANHNRAGSRGREPQQQQTHHTGQSQKILKGSRR